MSHSLTEHWAAPLALAVFAFAYLLVVLEDLTGLRKSKPVLAAAGLVWLIAAFAASSDPGQSAETIEAFDRNLLEYAQILLFLVVAVTYVNVLQERGVFEALRWRLVAAGWSLRQLFWATGGLAFVLSPVADNMTSALILGAVVTAVGGGDPRFVATAFTNVVIAANAGGAFSPFGDITTLMVWQAGQIDFWTFFNLIPAALVAWLVPAFLIARGVPNLCPAQRPTTEPASPLKPGALIAVALFAVSIASSVAARNAFNLPPVFGMLFIGLPLIKLYGYALRVRASATAAPFDIMRHVRHMDWDTLLFFGGVIMAIGGIGRIGYLAFASEALYDGRGEAAIALANAAVGVASAVIDNIPLVFAVLQLGPEMSQWQWLLVTLTAGIGGSLLSIGSAAGVALMGASKGAYTFRAHLAHTPAIAAGYVAAIAAHWAFAAAFARGLF